LKIIIFSCKNNIIYELFKISDPKILKLNKLVLMAMRVKCRSYNTVIYYTIHLLYNTNKFKNNKYNYERFTNN